MTNTPGGFRDPGGRNTSRLIGIAVLVLVVLLLLAWFAGLFGAAEEAVEVDGDAAVVTEDGVVSEEAVKDAAEEAEEAAD